MCSVNREQGSASSCQLTSLQESNLVILSQHTEAWDVLCKLNHILHGVSQSDGAVLPHLVHRLKVSASWRKDKSERVCVCEQLQKFYRLYVFVFTVTHTTCYVMSASKGMSRSNYSSACFYQRDLRMRWVGEIGFVSFLFDEAKVFCFATA